MQNNEKYHSLWWYVPIIVLIVWANYGSDDKKDNVAARPPQEVAASTKEQPLAEALGDKNGSSRMNGIHFEYVTKYQETLFGSHFDWVAFKMQKAIKWMKEAPEKRMDFATFTYEVHADTTDRYGKVTKDKLVYRLRWKREVLEKIQPATIQPQEIILFARFYQHSAAVKEDVEGWCANQERRDGDICRH